MSLPALPLPFFVRPIAAPGRTRPDAGAMGSLTNTGWLATAALIAAGAAFRRGKM
ncbi:MAG: hypothetical protein ACK5LJ_12530 [Paracoccus sp. (in: a-proteobacteria)]